ncbi:MAG: hypothetical protein U0Q22_14280 [Acidimicrobiales bacterium]
MLRVRTVIAPVTLLLAAVVAGGCSSAPDAATGPTTTSIMDMTDMPGMDMSTVTGADGKVVCAQHMPGDVLTAEQAMVIFDKEHVCLGYATIKEGTPITWHNADTATQYVTVTDEKGAEVMHFDVDPGGSASRLVKPAGVYRYKVTAIESFVGTIEVHSS